MSAHKLRDKTLDLFRNRPASLKMTKIAEDTGLGLSWLKKFHATGETYIPLAENLIKLHDHLNKTKLKI